MYLLGEKYIDSISTMASSENASIVLLPGDLPASVRSLLGTMKS